MCNPMVDYVKGLKAYMKMGAIVDEMDKTIRNGRVELGEARNKVSEEEKIQASFKLKETEEKFQGIMKEEHDRDDMVLWELLKKKRKYQTPESPMGTRRKLLNSVPKSKHHKPPREARQPLMGYSPVGQSCQQGGLLRGPLGSPSAAISASFFKQVHQSPSSCF
ncbi:putative JHL07K02.14 protein [Melia azedarach]|uniref:JHL07K02.14 protein n=1 Tax=Melia azedarach TaxID=155640 RepID=A0ACC1XUX4_MELAZ|nr:putative JHL07K02.14 protein [Melia azedarach]